MLIINKAFGPGVVESVVVDVRYPRRSTPLWRERHIRHRAKRRRIPKEHHHVGASAQHGADAISRICDGRPHALNERPIEAVIFELPFCGFPSVHGMHEESPEDGLSTDPKGGREG